MCDWSNLERGALNLARNIQKQDCLCETCTASALILAAVTIVKGLPDEEKRGYALATIRTFSMIAGFKCEEIHEEHPRVFDSRH